MLAAATICDGCWQRLEQDRRNHAPVSAMQRRRASGEARRGGWTRRRRWAGWQRAVGREIVVFPAACSEGDGVLIIRDVVVST